MDPEILKFKVTKVQQISVRFEENWFEKFAPTMN